MTAPTTSTDPPMAVLVAPPPAPPVVPMTWAPGRASAGIGWLVAAAGLLIFLFLVITAWTPDDPIIWVFLIAMCGWAVPLGLWMGVGCLMAAKFRRGQVLTIHARVARFTEKLQATYEVRRAVHRRIPSVGEIDAWILAQGRGTAELWIHEDATAAGGGADLGELLEVKVFVRPLDREGPQLATAIEQLATDALRPEPAELTSARDHAVAARQQWIGELIAASKSDAKLAAARNIASCDKCSASVAVWDEKCPGCGADVSSAD